MSESEIQEAQSSTNSLGPTQNAAVTVVNRHLNIAPFQLSRDSNDTAVRWAKWKKNIERQFRFFGIIDPQLKKDGLIIYGGQEIADLDDSIPDPTLEGEQNEYTQLIAKLDQHFLPKKNKDYARFKLGNLIQQDDEPMATYYARIREIAKKCSYTDEDDAIRDHIIKTMRNNAIRVKAIRNNWTLQQILDEAAISEQAQLQAREIKEKLEATGTSQRVKYTKQDSCQRCGRKHDKGKCPAYGEKCRKCGKLNHFAIVCKSHPTRNPNEKNRNRRENPQYRRQDNKLKGKGQQNRPYSRRDDRKDNQKLDGGKPNIRHVEKTEENFSSSSSDSSNDEDFIQHLRIKQTTRMNRKKISKSCTVKINGVATEIEPDTGSDANIMDEEQFRRFQKTRPEIRLKKSRIKLRALLQDIPVLGECSVIIQNQTRQTRTRMIVIKGKMDSLPLIGRPTLSNLGMVLIDETGNLSKETEQETSKVKKVTEKHQKLEEILKKYEERFQGIGKAKRDEKDIEIHLPMNENATPIAQKPRRVPYHLLKPLEERINEFVESDIIEKVPEHEAIEWCSPLVVQPKAKNPKDIRVSLDLRMLNQSMSRTRNVQTPITEDFVNEFKDCTIFSKIDLNHGYHQFALDEESRKIMTFSTPWGNYRYKRLAFGGKNSQDLFDAEIAKIISCIPHVLNNRDDIMVGGKDWEEHNRNLETVLERLKIHNLTLRREKCEFGQTSIEFHGHQFTSEGLRPSPSKVRAIKEMERPKTKEELVSFIQMIAYLSRFIENFSSRSEPLRRLTKQGHSFEWNREQQLAFDDLRNAMTTTPVLIPYQPGRKTLVICDASPVGLGGGLFQRTAHGYQPVHYVSRTLTETERKYAQVEREALAVEFSTTRLQMYLLGSKQFQIATDHKPLLPIFNNPNAKLPPRLERLRMKTQHLDFAMIHIPGKSNMTDYLSRHPLPDEEETYLERHVRAVIATEHAVVLDKIREETSKDNELQTLIQTIRTGNWKNTGADLKQYYDVRTEIYEADGVVLRGNRIIPPNSLKKKIISIAHKQGHLGISKTKEMIRNKYWFPSMNLQIENVVQSCFSCQIATNTFHTEPAKMTTMPRQPWEVVELDFCGPFPNGEYAIVLTDQFSRYPEVEFTRSIAIAPVKERLKKIFATHGVPKVVQTDNGPPFNSHEFKQFANEIGFIHKPVTPYHPKAQGQVENFNKLMNKIAAIANENHTNFHEATYDMLQAYRSTPHPATKIAPYQLLMNRQVRTKLDHFPTEISPKDDIVRRNDQQYKEKAKRNHDKRHRTKEYKLKIGDAVIVKREKRKKGETPYEPYIYVITKIKGSMVTGKKNE